MLYKSNVMCNSCSFLILLTMNVNNKVIMTPLIINVCTYKYTYLYYIILNVIIIPLIHVHGNNN